mmetsp:Transcript_20/g.32  ORF Transcript_20/g.32 Transcript_20/m.32 type:complete len:171 (-) Transcript_20:23-535(-)
MSGNDCEQHVLPDDMVVEFQEIFSLIDTDGSGAISSTEICELVESVGMQVAEDDLLALMNKLDSDKSGVVEYTEFLSAMSSDLVPVGLSTHEIEKAFRTVAEQSAAPVGTIDLKVLASTLRHGSQLNDSEVAGLLEKFRSTLITVQGSDREFFCYSDFLELLQGGTLNTH